MKLKPRWQLDGLRKNYEWFEVFVVRCLSGGSMGCELTELCGLRGHVWLIVMNCLHVLHVDPFPFHVLKLRYVHKGEIFKEGFHVLK